MFALALAPAGRKASAIDAASGPDPQPVIDEIAAIDSALDDIAALPMSSADEQAAAKDAAASIVSRIKALPFDDLSEIADPAWHDAANAMRDLHNRLADLAGKPHDESVKRLGGNWGTKRRRLLDDIIVDGFYSGMYYAGKAAWWTLKTAIKLAIAGGKLAAPHIARAARAAAAAIGDGIVKVEAYVRADGTAVDAYTRNYQGQD